MEHHIARLEAQEIMVSAPWLSAAYWLSLNPFGPIDSWNNTGMNSYCCALQEESVKKKLYISEIAPENICDKKQVKKTCPLKTVVQ